MNRAEFEHALLLHGSDLSKWPNAAAARAILAEDAEARALYAEAQRLDAGLAEATAYPALGSAEIGRVLQHARPARVPVPGGRRFAAAAALASCVVAGGFMLGQASAIDTARADTALIALAGGSLDLLGDLP